MQKNILKLWIEKWDLSNADAARVLLINKSKVSEYLSGKRAIPPYIAAHIETFNELSELKAKKMIKERVENVPNGN